MSPGKRIGFAVVGLGSISQVAVLPAFAHSKKAALVAVVSGRKEKAWTLALQFNASQAFTYDEFSECLQNPQIEAVYIATPPGELFTTRLLSSSALCAWAPIRPRIS